MVKRNGTKRLVNVVNDVLVGDSRRIVLGMACHCLRNEVYADLEYKEVENAGICLGECNVVVDRYMFAHALQPEALLKYIWGLTACPSGGFDRLVELKAFYRLTGHQELIFLVSGGNFEENRAGILPSTMVTKAPASTIYDGDQGTSIIEYDIKVHICLMMRNCREVRSKSIKGVYRSSRAAEENEVATKDIPL